MEVLSRKSWALGLVMALAGLVGGCDLNPQPLPPGEAEDAMSPATVDNGADSSMGSSGFGVSDGGEDGGRPVITGAEGGSDGASDAGNGSADAAPPDAAPSDASLDSGDGSMDAPDDAIAEGDR